MITIHDYHFGRCGCHDNHHHYEVIVKQLFLLGARVVSGCRQQVLRQSEYAKTALLCNAMPSQCNTMNSIETQCIVEHFVYAIQYSSRPPRQLTLHSRLKKYVTASAYTEKRLRTNFLKTKETQL